MVNEKIAQVVAALEEVGIPSGRGYSGSKIRVLRDPFVTVCMEGYSQEQITLAVDIYVPAEQGGSVCEATALRVVKILEELFALCTVGECHFSGHMGLFTQRIVARWQRELGYAIRVDGVAVPRVLALHAEKNTVRLPYVSAESGELEVSVGGLEWKITLKDLCPMNQKLEDEQTAPFTLLMMRPGGVEAFFDCMWTKMELEETPVGILRTRVAVTNQDRVVAGG